MLTIKLPEQFTIATAGTLRLSSGLQASSVHITADNEFQFITDMGFEAAAKYIEEAFSGHRIELDPDHSTFTITPFDPSWN